MINILSIHTGNNVSTFHLAVHVMFPRDESQHKITLNPHVASDWTKILTVSFVCPTTKATKTPFQIESYLKKETAVW